MQQRFSRLLPVLALAYVFLFFGMDKFMRPLLWIGWIPPSFDGFLGLSPELWLRVVGAYEIALGALLLVSRERARRIVAWLMAFHLVFVLTQTGLFTSVGVRDTGLLLLSVGLGLRRE